VKHKGGESKENIDSNGKGQWLGTLGGQGGGGGNNQPKNKTDRPNKGRKGFAKIGKKKRTGGRTGGGPQRTRKLKQRGNPKKQIEKALTEGW